MDNVEEYVPKPWNKGIDQNGQPYYVNKDTGQIRRQPPVTAGFQSYQKNSAFIDPEQWDIVIDTMASTIHPQQQLRIFQKLKKIAEKMITKDDPKYRTLYLNNPRLQHTVLAFDGGLEFLYNLGFEPHVTARDKLVCHEVNARVVQACLICLEDKIEVLSYNDAYDQQEQNNYISSGGHSSGNHQGHNQLQQGGSGGSSNYPNHSNGGHSNYPNQPPPVQPHELMDPMNAQKYNEYNQMHSMHPNFAQNGMNPQHHQSQQYYNGPQHHQHHHQQHQQHQQQNDKAQVMHNLSALGFQNPSNSMSNSNQNKSGDRMGRFPTYHPEPESQYQSDPIPRPYSVDINMNGNNGRNGKRPVPPPPISGRNGHGNGMNEQMYHQSVDSGGSVRESVIDRNVYDNIAHGNARKLEERLGLQNHRKMYKTFIFIRHGNSIWNKFKAAGKKRKMAAMFVGLQEYIKLKNNPENHADTWVVDAPLSRIGIDEAYGLSKFLGRHLTLRQFESLADLEHHQSLATPIKDALRIVHMGILEEHAEALQQNPDLLAKCKQIADIMEEAHRKIQGIMLRTEARRGGNNAQIQSKAKALGMGPVPVHVTKGGDVIPEDEALSNPTDEIGMGNGSVSPLKAVSKSSSNEPVLLQGGSGVEDNVLLMDDEKIAEQELNARPFSHVVIANAVEKIEEQDQLEMPLEIEWVLDQMVDSLGDSIVVTSNLRRAISTAVISLWDRFSTTKECIHILPCLQELGMNVDTHTPILEAQVPQVSTLEKEYKKLNVSKLTEFYNSRLRVEQALGALGKKSMRETASDTVQRLKFFCDWAFKKVDDNGDPYNTIIACGHSHWMRAFFKHFLPKDTTSMAGKMKIQNCGVVGFRMICTIGPENQREYQIIGKSITPIYRGFQM